MSSVGPFTPASHSTDQQKEMSAGCFAWHVGGGLASQIGLGIMAAWESSLRSQKDISYPRSSRGTTRYKLAMGFNTKPGSPRAHGLKETTSFIILKGKKMNTSWSLPSTYKALGTMPGASAVKSGDTDHC